MVFSDRAFLFLFLPVAILTILALSRVRLRLISITLLSLGFYFYSSGLLILTLIFCLIVSFVGGIVVEFDKRKWVLSLFLILIFLPLLYFKYAFFVAQSFGVPSDSQIGSLLRVVLPAGISFFTFQAVAYLVDVYRGELRADRSLLRYGAYLSFFPQLIAGPIVRYKDVHEDFEANHESVDRFTEGVVRFIHGLLKKLLIADSAGRIADACFGLAGDDVTFAAAWAGALAYTIQIYFDFSGYSDMAIGLGKMFGIKFPENFRAPYESRSITEFWRRWHISLSNWFRDYLYIPLGGNRSTQMRVYVNLMLVFAATGIWHGAAWTFVIWGLYHGAFILMERFLFGSSARRFSSEWVRFAYLLPVVMVGWVIFRADSLRQAGEFIVAMLVPFSSEAWTMPDAVWVAATPGSILMLLIGCTVLFKKTDRPVGVFLEGVLKSSLGFWLVFAYSALGMAVVSIIALSSNFSPFLYFQF
ncbi:MBOAT family O-acyltransferase [Maricaulis parjimensis]|uniref:MBOAT family O-acyltransferase n=1 Tax=Maricaulis parjimensis TaxID=144023 RepID=UPI001939B640|nr:MBOAT family O-acyltransferase [Maricaulis parjimensis]